MIEDEARGPLNNVDAAATPQPGELLLRVKSAQHPSCEDLEFHAKASLSVRQIKETIQRLSAQHPEVKEQRLIYSGHLLDDNQVLKDVLTANNGSHLNPPHQAVTFHLACSSKYIFNSSSHSSSRANSQKPGNEGHPAGNGITQQPLFNNLPPANMGMPQVDGGVPQDVISLHQQYVEQMTAYMNNWYMYQGAMGGMFYQFPQPPVANFAPPPAAAPFQPQNNIPAPNRVPDNVAAARAVDEDDNQRDVLDWMYTLSRVVLVFSVVYFYSSFFRFLLVILLSSLVIILQRRNNIRVNQNAADAAAGQREAAPGQGEAEVNPPPPNPHPGAEQQQQEGNRQENESGSFPPGPRDPNQEEAGEGSSETNPSQTASETANTSAEETSEGNQEGTREEEQQQVAVQPPQANLREVALTFLTTFFTSLIPDNYQNN